jgi:hypothetical protein
MSMQSLYERYLVSHYMAPQLPIDTVDYQSMMDTAQDNICNYLDQTIAYQSVTNALPDNEENFFFYSAEGTTVITAAD